MLTDSQWDELQSLVKAAARRVAAQWPEVVERDDLEQDMFVHLIERPGVIERVFSEEQQVRQSFLIKMAHQLASEARTQYDHFSGNYLYDSDEIRGYLDRKVWLTEEWSSEKIDMAAAFASLADANSAYYAALVNRFVHGIVPNRLDKAAHNRVSRAVDALTERMNRIGADRRRDYIEGPGTRQVLSNAHAMHLTKNQDN